MPDKQIPWYAAAAILFGAAVLVAVLIDMAVD